MAFFSQVEDIWVTDHSIKRGVNGNYYFPVVSKFLYHVINDFWKLQITNLRLLLNIVVRWLLILVYIVLFLMFKIVIIKSTILISPRLHDVQSCIRYFFVFCLLVCLFFCLKVMVMVFNATFNNISIILCKSVLLVEETGVPGKTPPT